MADRCKIADDYSMLAQQKQDDIDIGDVNVHVDQRKNIYGFVDEEIYCHICTYTCV